MLKQHVTFAFALFCGTVLVVDKSINITTFFPRGCFVGAQVLKPDQNRKKWGDVSARSDSSAFEQELEQQKTENTLLSPFVFRTDQPGHVLEGASNLIVNTAKGVLLGTSTFLGLPIIGVKYGGLKGLIFGALLGTVAGITLPVAGVLLGLSQLIKGIQCTPSAIQNSLDKRQNGCSSEYLLDGEAKEIKELIKKGDSKRKEGSTNVKVTLFYDLLNVSPDATPAEIKRGYYKTAKESHPDKSDDPDAAEQFRKIHTAYQTLSDSKRRELYDRNGPSMTADGRLNTDDPTTLTSAIDPIVFFGIMFGSESVEPYIGELRMASEVQNFFEFVSIVESGEAVFDESGYFLSESKTTESKRQVDIALHLRERISSYVVELVPESEFIESCRNEAETIASATYGGVFLKAIGASMVLEADEFLGYHTAIIGWLKGGVTGLKKKVLSKRRELDVYLTIVRASRGLLGALSESASFVIENGPENGNSGSFLNRDWMSKPDVDTEKLERELLHSLSSFLEMAWAFNIRDVTTTVKNSCHKLLVDEGVSLTERLRRAEAIRIMGHEFLVVGKKFGGNEMIPRSMLEDIQARAEVAFTSATMKAQGYDVPMSTDEEIFRRRAENNAKDSHKFESQNEETVRPPKVHTGGSTGRRRKVHATS